MSGTKRQEQKALTRVRILETAFLYYSREGFSVTTSDIAKAAGVSHGAVFVHFPTREALLQSVLEDFMQQVCDKLHRLTLEQAGIAELLKAHIEVLKPYEALYSNVIRERSSLPEEAVSLLMSAQSIMSHHFGLVLEGERHLGRVKDIPRHMLFNTWMGLLHYYLMNQAFFAPDESVLNRYQDELIGSFVKLISI